MEILSPFSEMPLIGRNEKSEEGLMSDHASDRPDPNDLDRFDCRRHISVGLA